MVFFEILGGRITVEFGTLVTICGFLLAAGTSTVWGDDLINILKEKLGI